MNKHVVRKLFDRTLDTSSRGSGFLHASLGTEYVHIFSINIIKFCSIPQNTTFEIGIEESTAKNIPIGIIRNIDKIENKINPPCVVMLVVKQTLISQS